MRKTYLNADAENGAQPHRTGRFTADNIATVAVTSEAADSPVEHLFAGEDPRPWRAGKPGKQTIRLTFEEPVFVNRIELAFSERARERTQEFSLSWAKSVGGNHQELVRQRWNFSPSGSQAEQEDFRYKLEGLMELELTIIPDVSGGDAIASLDRFDVS